MVGRGSIACLVTLVDRMSGLLVGGRAATHTKRDVADVETAALAGVPRAARRRWTWARSSPTSRGSRRRPARSSTSRRPAIPGSAAPTRTPTAWSASTPPRTSTSTRPATNGSVRCMTRSTAGRASAMASGRPTRSTIRRRCTCPENSDKKHTPSKGTREERVLISLFAKQLEGADQDQSRDVITITPCNDRLLSKGHSN